LKKIEQSSLKSQQVSRSSTNRGDDVTAYDIAPFWKVARELQSLVGVSKRTSNVEQAQPRHPSWCSGDDLCNTDGRWRHQAERGDVRVNLIFGEGELNEGLNGRVTNDRLHGLGYP
jgi:hypothetical protein